MSRAVVDEFDVDAELRQEAEQEAAEEQRRIDEARRGKGALDCMSTDTGRFFMRHVLSFTAEGDGFNTNALEMARIAGKRQVGNALRAFLKTHCRAQYVQLMQEQIADE
jgi:hypothetical protein